MHTMEFLGRFKMSAHVKNIFSLKFFVLIDTCIQKGDFFVRYFSRQFNGRLAQ